MCTALKDTRSPNTTHAHAHEHRTWRAHKTSSGPTAALRAVRARTAGSTSRVLQLSRGCVTSWRCRQDSSPAPHPSSMHMQLPPDPHHNGTHYARSQPGRRATSSRSWARRLASPAPSPHRPVRNGSHQVLRRRLHPATKSGARGERLTAVAATMAPPLGHTRSWL